MPQWWHLHLLLPQWPLKHFHNIAGRRQLQVDTFVYVSLCLLHNPPTFSFLSDKTHPRHQHPCLISHHYCRTVSTHCTKVHSVINDQERSILTLLASGCLNVRSQACPICYYRCCMLDRHLKESRFNRARVEVHPYEAIGWRCIDLLAARATYSHVSLAGTSDVQAGVHKEAETYAPHCVQQLQN